MMRRAFPLLMASLAAAACSPRTASAPAAQAATPPPPLPADVGKVAEIVKPGAPEAAGREEADRRVTATGEFVSPVHSSLVAKQPGRVGKIFVDEGVRVAKGQPLLELETDYLSLDVKRAEAEAARAEAVADDAEKDFARKQDLIGKGSVAPATYERSQATYLQAKAARAVAAAALEQSRQRVADAVLRSPIDGVVAERHTDVGERLGDSSVAFLILQTSPLKLRFRAPERYLGAIRLGQAVRASVDPYAGETFTGRVKVVGQVIDPATRTLTVDTEFPNADGRLRPGLFARVELDLTKAVAKAEARP